MDRSQDPVIIAACRTPIGRYLGGLNSFSAIDLGAIAAKEAVHRSGLDHSRFDETIIGNVLSAGLGQAPARQVALRAGLPPTSSALTLNMVCGSGLRAVMLADQAIRSGDASILLAGGMESMSNAPHLLRGGRAGWKIGDNPLIDSMQLDGLTCAIEHWPMGMAAERTAEHCGLTRESIDAWAVISQSRALHAIDQHWFAAEMVPVVLTEKGQPREIINDEGPRLGTTLEGLAKLKPAFKPDGVVTAGNSSTLSDGAAMLVVASSEAAKRSKREPMARIIASATSGREPCDLFLAPIEAIQKALSKAKLTINDIDLFEINEAFCSQLLGCVQGLDLDPDKVNIQGGATALGHPIGASGARVLVTLLHSLHRLKKRYGVASLCLGGGNAVAIVVDCSL